MASKKLGSFRLLRRALGHFRHHWTGYWRIVAVTALPVGFLGLFMGASSDTTLSAYLALASLVMTTALVWAMARQFAGRTTQMTARLPRPVSVARSYYDGSELFVKFMLVGLSLVSMVVPLAIGLGLLNVSLSVTGFTNLISPEQLIITAVCALIALPTFYLLGGYSLGLIAVARDGGRPIEALRTARKLVRGSFWSTVARLILLIIWMSILLAPMAVAAGLLVNIGYVGWAKLLFQYYSWFIILPIMYLYLFELYISLEDQSV